MSLGAAGTSACATWRSLSGWLWSREKSSLAGVLILLAAGCSSHRDSGVTVVHEEAPAPKLASVVQVADPAAAIQLLQGFHEVEQGSWRWTQKQFSLLLKTPPGGARGATLELKFALPEPVVARLGAVTLTASVSGSPLGPQTYTRPGDHVYSRTVPPAALAGEAVKVEFHLDKALPPGGADGRELGLVVSSVGLE